ncbi:hypothetical protein E6C76_13600 [Pseudothauera nasutitermitis]|uniref:Phage tail collar domain-containing protein n=1 Tax=Pseudothauera nasutitermitis TaxID=2565930 RepID=A0A4S4AUL6_9RHOO|nr:tail fiber protein [Pseudothauera nasutitermitis]THF63626.1 hypothetical protein E6C76_13600 [Pseudothauera nasutitermitis]
MKQRHSKRIRTLLLLTGLAGGLGTGTNALACAAEPYIGSVCIMAMVRTSFYGFLPANGATLNVAQYQALYSLVGNTYGGSAPQNFKIPDLRGRVVVGAGQASNKIYAPGEYGGAAVTTLTLSQIPQHTHTLGTGATATAGIGTLAASTTLSGLSGTVNGASFSLRGSSGGTLTNNPSGNSLGTSAGTVRVYSDAAPSVDMKSGSIGGSATIQFTGTPSTTLSGAPAVSLGGHTESTGGGQPISIMPPYLAMNYFIATSGTYPMQD